MRWNFQIDHKTTHINILINSWHFSILFGQIGFPFYTVGRFLNIPCTGQNQLLGTCVLNGECRSYGGVSTGSCNSKAKHAVCCVCKCPFWGCGDDDLFHAILEIIIAAQKFMQRYIEIHKSHRSTVMRRNSHWKQHLLCESKLSRSMEWCQSSVIIYSFNFWPKTTDKSTKFATFIFSCFIFWRNIQQMFDKCTAHRQCVSTSNWYAGFFIGPTNGWRTM